MNTTERLREESLRDVFSITGEYMRRLLHNPEQSEPVIFSGVFLSAREFPLRSPVKGVIFDGGIQYAIGGAMRVNPDIRAGNLSFRIFGVHHTHPEYFFRFCELTTDDDITWTGKLTSVIPGFENDKIEANVNLYKSNARSLDYMVLPNFNNYIHQLLNRSIDDLI